MPWCIIKIKQWIFVKLYKKKVEKSINSMISTKFWRSYKEKTILYINKKSISREHSMNDYWKGYCRGSFHMGLCITIIDIIVFYLRLPWMTINIILEWFMVLLSSSSSTSSSTSFSSYGENKWKLLNSAFVINA